MMTMYRTPKTCLIASLCLAWGCWSPNSMNGELLADTFQIVPSPEPATAETVILTSVDVIAPDDIWAVGLWRRDVHPFENLEYSLTLHFNGTQWSIVDSPSPPNNVGDIDVQLFDVAGVSSNEVYAAGTWTQFGNSAEAFLIEWDGDSWDQVLVVDNDNIPVLPIVEATAVAGSQSLWLGGQGYSLGVEPASLVHYDGTDFSRYDLPLINNGAHRIRDISILAEDDIWGVGAAGGQVVATGRNIVGRWDGSSFDLVSTPQYGFDENLNAVAAIAPDDVWASGVYRETAGSPMTPLFMHWDGSSWTRFDSPTFASDLVALASDSIYGVHEDHIVHWDGTSWQIIADLGLPSFQGMLRAIDTVSTNEFVTAGSLDFNAESLIASFVQMTMGDFDANGSLDGADVDALVQEIAAGNHTTPFDLTGDGRVNHVDLDAWLMLGGQANLPSGAPYLQGDANLDGVVDGSDFIVWNQHKFSASSAWTQADFNADGRTDGRDFLIWNANKFTTADTVAAVPEPGAVVWLVVLFLVKWRRLARTTVGHRPLLPTLCAEPWSSSVQPKTG